MFNNILSARFEYYEKYTKNTLLDYTMAPSVGFPTMKENLGRISNKGYEVTLRLMPYSDPARQAYWNVIFTCSHNKSLIEEISNALKVMNEKQMEIADEVDDPYVTGLPELTALTQEKALYEIHMQQWIDLMDRPFEEFVQWRRSGTAGNEVPTLQVPEDATSKELIRRWEYSPEEMTAKINAPKESPKIWEKLWFDL